MLPKTGPTPVSFNFHTRHFPLLMQPPQQAAAAPPTARYQRRRMAPTPTALPLLLFLQLLLLLLLLSPALSTAFVRPPVSRRPQGQASPTPSAAAAAAASTTTTGVDTLAALLAKAATTRKVPSSEVFAAMEALEAATKGSSQKKAKAPATAPAGFSFPFFNGPTPNAKAKKTKGVVSLTDVAAAGEGGRWEIVYSSILKSGYMPGAICEIVSIQNNNEKSSPNGIRIDNTAFGGVLPLGSVVGDYTWEAAAPSQKARMTFGFDTFELGPFLSVKTGARKNKSYDFFWVDGAIACARSSAGGLTLMRRVVVD